jgi:hypothetical protein
MIKSFRKRAGVSSSFGRSPESNKQIGPLSIVSAEFRAVFACDRDIDGYDASRVVNEDAWHWSLPTPFQGVLVHAVWKQSVPCVGHARSPVLPRCDVLLVITKGDLDAAKQKRAFEMNFFLQGGGGN